MQKYILLVLAGNEETNMSAEVNRTESVGDAAASSAVCGNNGDGKINESCTFQSQIFTANKAQSFY